MRDYGWSLSPKDEGLRVLRVFDGMGASRVGLRAGDLIVEIDGTPVYERDLCEREDKARARVAVSVLRDGERLEFDVPLDTVVP